MTEIKKIVRPPSESVKLRLVFIHRPLRKNFWTSNSHPFLVQNEAFEYGVKIINIDSKPFSGATIELFRIQINFGGTSLVQDARNKLSIKSLNPEEDCELYVGKYLIRHEGSIKIEVDLLPVDKSISITAHQYHDASDYDEEIKEKNKWFIDYFCQGEQQIIQTRTSNIILVLTLVTFVEAVVGLRYLLDLIVGFLVLHVNYLIGFLGLLINTSSKI